LTDIKTRKQKNRVSEVSDKYRQREEGKKWMEKRTAYLLHLFDELLQVCRAAVHVSTVTRARCQNCCCTLTCWSRGDNMDVSLIITTILSIYYGKG
jgi:hypothetical protein